MLVQQIIGFRYNALYFIMFAAIFSFGYTKLNVNNVAHHALTMMESQGGYTQNVDQYIREYCSKHKLDYSKMKIVATPYPVNYNGTLSIDVTYAYIPETILGNKPFDVTADGYISSEFIIR